MSLVNSSTEHVLSDHSGFAAKVSCLVNLIPP